MYIFTLHFVINLLSLKVCDSESLCACRKDISSNEFELRPLEEAAYRAHFNGVEHWNYFTDEPDIGPIVLSLKQEPCGEKFRLDYNANSSVK